MRVTPFQMEVLGRVADDFEAVHTIRGDIERDLAREVSDEEVGSALLALVELGFVEPFVYDESNSKYQRAVTGANPLEKLWFSISKVGRTEYERSAV